MTTLDNIYCFFAPILIILIPTAVGISFVVSLLNTLLNEMQAVTLALK